MFRKTRIKWAFKCGKLEHRFGRLIGLMTFISFMYVHRFNPDLISEILIGLVFLCWLIYVASHTVEKKLFGNHGPRSGWK